MAVDDKDDCLIWDYIQDLWVSKSTECQQVMED